MTYVKIKHLKDDKVYIMMEDRLSALFKKEGEYEVQQKYIGSDLKGKCYKPLFNYFSEYKEKRGAFKVVTGTYVTNDSGTGIVHQAPYFGHDDYAVCMENGIITKDDVICPVDESGRFTEEVTDFAGQVPSFVKEKRFANWLRDAHDWTISRNRYWVPHTLWVSDDLEEIGV
ncbi:putative isoleucine--tRNA ligase, cytoplasmic isoform X2 [Apostichopus japonicus]|uniref:Putative isoleucine--tRNA ligase, cytoplasmic isoform X2 n=1 Tax=Stichopus japonicus TaxID=307972 RepID=A0A2G8JIA7_STIJA|nr:putative isoleucine--tRNA ligase, cytoplasmic isoform X2 [Apostichopus japonicus]